MHANQSSINHFVNQICLATTGTFRKVNDSSGTHIESSFSYVRFVLYIYIYI